MFIESIPFKMDGSADGVVEMEKLKGIYISGYNDNATMKYCKNCSGAYPSNKFYRYSYKGKRKTSNICKECRYRSRKTKR